MEPGLRDSLSSMTQAPEPHARCLHFKKRFARMELPISVGVAGTYLLASTRATSERRSCCVLDGAVQFGIVCKLEAAAATAAEGA